MLVACSDTYCTIINKCFLQHVDLYARKGNTPGLACAACGGTGGMAVGAEAGGAGAGAGGGGAGAAGASAAGEEAALAATAEETEGKTNVV